ncbi:monosaccharide ABC transporter ATP-binding protein, CUT2 family [Desulfonatronum zhilinae]|nr:monosaccharide ABC transporter ATP-binding protein, CUT2 family [Desulfonatronum zhilinae]
MSLIVEMANISKSYGEIKALDNVSFALGSNEVVGLLGDNGAGKSTLIKILAGVTRADAGTMHINGQAIDPRGHTVAKARKLGIETVFQDKSLGEKQPLWSNFFVGRHLTNRWGFIDVAAEMRVTRKILGNILGLQASNLRPETIAGTLSGGERQGVAIGRAMHFNSRIVVLDEPTTALSLREVDNVLSFVRHIKRQGKACVYISHNINHVHAVADRFVIVDKGKIALDLPKDGTTLEELIKVMIRIADGEVPTRPGGHS